MVNYRKRKAWSSKSLLGDEGNLRDGATAKIRRHGSKMLSVLGLSRSEKSVSSKSSELTKDAAILQRHESLLSSMAYYPNLEPKMHLDFTGHDSTNPRTLVPSFVHKISTTFAHPTVVHRPGLRTRPSVKSLHEDRTSLPQDNTDPSSYYNSGSVSQGDRSTGKTSFDVASLRTEHDRLGSGFARIDSIPEEQISGGSLTPIPEAPIIITPTIVTVETTANAKIFFETHFNPILAGHTSPRSQRRHALEARLDKEALSTEQRQRERRSWALQESIHLRRSRVLKTKTNDLSCQNAPSVCGYEIVKVLGKGSFGVVRLVRQNGDIDLEAPTATSRKSSEVFAMKVIRKSDMLRNSQEGHLRAERDFLVSSEKSRWVAPLVSSFQDTTNLYLVMEYMVGGDFLCHLIRHDVLKEKKARWYVAEMILCVEEAHKLGWIHRDIKPDNFLISASGHLKISDFGLAFDGHWQHDQSYFNNHRNALMQTLDIEVEGDSLDRKEGKKVATCLDVAGIFTGTSADKAAGVDGSADKEGILQWRDRHGKRKLAKSIVGTPQYMAPEIIRGELYDGRCDWWSIGIILYECLYGWTPFVCESKAETKKKIINHATTLAFPSQKELDKKNRASYEAMDLIYHILQEKEHRLCSKKYMLNDFQHSKHVPGQLVAVPANKHSRDYRGYFVYADDATDIKNHAFFGGIHWDRLHLSRPPFVPDVRSREDTRYFENEDDPISDVESSDSSGDETSVASPSGQPPFHGDQQDGADQLHPQEAGEAPLKVKKEKKRPKDQALRDKVVGKQVLEIRKRGAFRGYTYRRPKPPGSSSRALRSGEMFRPLES